MPHAQQRQQQKQRQQKQQKFPVGPMENGRRRWRSNKRLEWVRARQQQPQQQQAPVEPKENMKGSWRSDERLEWVRQQKQQQQQQLLKRRWQSGIAPSPSADTSAETASLHYRINMAAARLVMRNNDDVCVCEDDHKSLDKRMEKRRKVNDSVGEGEDIACLKAPVEANSEIVVIDNTNEEKSGAEGGILPSHAHFLSHEGGITRGNKMNDNDSATANSQMKINDEHSANAETAKPSNGAISDESENRHASNKKIIIVVTKISKANKLGLQICQVEDERMGESFVQVTSIAPNGLFSGTRIKVGMKLLSINGKECNTVKDAIDLAKAVEGELKIAAASVVKGAVLHELSSNIRSETNKTKTIVVKKPSRDSKLGLNLIQVEDETNGEFFVRVLSMATNSLLRGTSLKVGMTLLSINGKECKTVKDAVDLFMAAEGTLKICLSSSVEAAVIHKTHSNIRTEQTVVSSHSEYEPRELQTAMPGDDKGRVVSPSTDLIKLPNHADEKDGLKILLRACALEQYLDAFQAVGISSASELQGKMHDLSFMERFVEDAGLSASEAIRLQIRASRH
jgi:hypothetical protein